LLPRRSIVPRPALTRERVVDAALALIDRHGLEAFSMRQLARQLGVEAMALYHHFPSKAHLRRAVGDRLLAEIVPFDPNTDDWLGALREMAHSYRAVARRHPHAFALAILPQQGTVGSAAPHHAHLGLLRRAGFDQAIAILILRTIEFYACGGAVAEAATAATPSASASLADGIFATGLALILDAVRKLPKHVPKATGTP
jgi:AcrR family transcriptional regulator